MHGEKIAFPPPLFGNPPSKGKEIVDCEVFENMLIVLTQDNAFYYVRNLPNCLSFKPELIGLLSIRGSPTCFKAIPSAHSYSGNLDILCGHPDGGLVLLQEMKEVKGFSKIPFTNEEINRVEEISLSATGEFLAILLEGGVVVKLNSNFSKFLGRTDSEMVERARQVVWCGNEAVCLIYNEFVGILGPDNTKASMDIDHIKEGVFCNSELDGMRVFTTEKCEFWEKVDPSLQMTLSIGSFSPPALLLVAYEAYIENSASSGESIRNLQNNDTLQEAVDQLLEAASAEFDIDTQEKLLKAAAFGKTFLPPGTFDSNKLVNMVKHLKVLNNLRREYVARPITYHQLKYMRTNGEMLIKRLLDSHHHYLALQISKFWKLRQEHIFVHWACAKLTDQAFSDKEMCELICSKLNLCKSVSYTDIARKALDSGRKDLAIDLLENEPAISRKVPLLLHMGEYDMALDKAIDSSDPDLIYLVIMKIHEQDKAARDDPDFVPGATGSIEKVLSKNVAREMLLSYARQIDEDLLKQAFRYLKRPQEAGHFAIEKAYKYNDLRRRLELLSTARDLYSNYDRDPLYAVAAKEQLALIEKQKLLIKKTGDRSLVDLSVCDTIGRLLKQDQESEAEKLAKQFQISEKKMWYLKLKIKASQGDWPGVEALSKSKKNPPIGFRPFANIAVQRNQNQYAEQFILRVPEVDYQLNMLQYIGSYMKAAEVAVKNKLFDSLPEIAQKSNDRAVMEFVDSQLVGK
mmetsp:Transcript_324/g.338  ORF Transcript_324/g.338 Transcript_324/m.338 type:complete len:744 (+) Transcript_324:332-2563(+)